MTKRSDSPLCFAEEINIPALSVNKAWQGRRFKSPEYKSWEANMLYLLPSWKHGITKDKKIKVWLTFRFSNEASDIDNPIKPLLDVLQKKYGFNDKKIYGLYIEKELVKKGCEGVDIVIKVQE